MRQNRQLVVNNPELKTHSRRLLVIDDNPRVHEDIRKILCPLKKDGPDLQDAESVLFGTATAASQRSEFEIDSAFQGQDGLALLEKALAEGRPYSLAFVDVRMPPGWSGIETIARLWQADPQLQVVVCTAYSDYSWEEMRARVGQPDSLVVLKKPFDNVEVQQLAHALTKKWQLNLQAGIKMAELESLVAQRTAELNKANAKLAASEGNGGNP
jgi:CheY-like chemotaxis protein